MEAIIARGISIVVLNERTVEVLGEVHMRG